MSRGPRDKRMSIDEVVAELRDGMTIGIGGWGPRRKPMALVRAILRSDLTDLTIVSWGGAYSKSQQKAYHEPYMEKTGVTIINDDSSAEAVAKLRAMNEAGSITWDVVDVVAADALRLCDEGLAEGGAQRLLLPQHPREG